MSAETNAPTEGNPASKGTVIKDELVWLDDGNIVILVGPGAPVPDREVVPNGDVYAFKCHKSMLARYSTVFRQLFETPGSSEDPAMDGVPTMSLPDDPDDLRNLLRILYGFL